MASKSRKTKTTFRVSPQILSEFQEYIEAFGLRRDKYLNRVLPKAIFRLRRANTNSPVAEKFWKAMRDVRERSLQKVAVLLESDVLSDLNAVCAEKRIPRDQFFQTVLECLVQVPATGDGPAPLPTALSLIEDPWEQWSSFGGADATPFDHIIWPQFDEEDLQKALQSESLPRT